MHTPPGTQRGELALRAHDGAEAVGGGPCDFADNTAGDEACCLCARPGKYSLLQNFYLCFPCTRGVLLSYMMPRVNTPERREGCAAFVERVQRLSEETTPFTPQLSAAGARRAAARRRKGSAETESPLGVTQRGDFSATVRVVGPPRVDVVVDASETRHGAQSNGNTAQRDVGSEVLRSNGEFWTCPECTFLNSAADSLVCEACQFKNISSVICDVCEMQYSLKEERLSVCPVLAALHIVWTCVVCNGVNKVDSDVCRVCESPVIWACSNCTVQQESHRTVENLRICYLCHSFHTPVEVMRSQATLVQQRCDRGGQSDVVFGVNDAGTLEEKSRQQSIEEAKYFLAQRLRLLGVLRVNEQPADGNCLFSSLASQLFGEPQNHMFVRNLVVDYMHDHAESYSVLFDGENDWLDYLWQMRHNGVWGDELCLNAAARCFCVDIHVITSETGRWHIVFRHDALGASQCGRCPANGSAADGAFAGAACPHVCLFLAYVSPVHYDDIMPFHAPGACGLENLLSQGLREILGKREMWPMGETNSRRLPPPSSMRLQSKLVPEGCGKCIFGRRRR